MTAKKQTAKGNPEKEMSTLVLTRIKQFTDTGELQIPNDFSPANALKAAMLILQEQKDRNGKPVLEVCSKDSIAKALLKMCIEGLSPLKNQGYFIPYGEELIWQRSYQGSIALAKRVGGVKDVPANVIYQEDTFNYRVDPATGYKQLLDHTPNIDNIGNDKIKGAYAIVIYEDGRTDLEVMTLPEIQSAWAQGATKGNSPAHKNFTQEMCKKTVINRACKGPINSSSDITLFGEDGRPDLPEEEEIVDAEIVDETASAELPEAEEKQDAKSSESSDSSGPGF